jgi:hypothetical protein
MSRVLNFTRGMRVRTSWGAVARVEGVMDGERVVLTFLDRVRRPLQHKDTLTAYEGPPVLFADEIDDIRRRDKLRTQGAKR